MKRQWILRAAMLAVGAALLANCDQANKDEPAGAEADASTKLALKDSPTPQKGRHVYSCADGRQFEVKLHGVGQPAELSINGGVLVLDSLPAAQGSRFADAFVTLRLMGKLAEIEQNGDIVYGDCTHT